MKKVKVIITGGTGLLGGTAPLVMQDSWNICLWTRSHTARFPGITSKEVKLDSVQEIEAAIDDFKPDLVIHAAGMTNVEDCERNQYRAYLSNVVSSKNIAKVCQAKSIQMIYVSTDHVLQDKEKSREDEIGFPANVYAKTKLEGEFEVLRHCNDAIIARVNFFTWGNEYRKSFLDYIVDSCRSRKQITLFEDVIFNPLSAEELLRLLDQLYRNGAKGCYNVTGDDSISKFEFGILVADIFSLDKSFIQKGRISQKPELVKRPKNLTLDNSKLKTSLNLSGTKSLSSMMSRLKDQEDAFKSTLYDKIQNTRSINMINYGKQSIDDADFESVLHCLGSSWLTQGPKVEEFEKRVADYVGAKYAVAMCNWTAGLHMSMLAAGVGKGDVVITSPLSFVASSNCALYVGATPVFVDIDPQTLNIDPVKVEEACRRYKNVKAIVPVHFAGAPCEMAALKKIADKYKAVLIEDAAHALGGKYLSGERIGNPIYSSMIGFSFHPVKNISTGEGGMILTNDEDIYRNLLRIRSHGITKGDDAFKNRVEAFTNGEKNQWYYEMQTLGYNFRITDLQCALGISQLEKLNQFHSSRIRLAKRYDEAFANLRNMKTVQHGLRTISGNHLYVGLVNFEKIGFSRHELYKKFAARNIHLHLHYIPIYRQPYYQENYAVNLSDFSQTENFYNQAVTFPLYASMSSDEIERVIAAANEFIG